MKVDYEKAYDNGNWNYIRFPLNRKGFGEKWKHWMEACIFNSSISVIINDSAIKGTAEEGSFILISICSIHGGTYKDDEKRIEIWEFKSYFVNEDM